MYANKVKSFIFYRIAVTQTKDIFLSLVSELVLMT